MHRKILLVDDHILFSNGLKLLLEQNPSWVICGQVSAAVDLPNAMQTLLPDLVMLDVNLNGVNGIDLGKKLVVDFKPVKVLILTMYDQIKLLEEARRAGLHGYLLKDSTPTELIEGIQTVLAGGTLFDLRVKQPGAGVDTVFNDDFARRLDLTFREVEIIRLIRSGLTNEQIAERLYISFFTVKSHRKNIHAKLGLTKVADVIQFANKHGL